MKLSTLLWRVLRVGKVPGHLYSDLISCACCQVDCDVSIAILSVKQRHTSASKTLRASETNDGEVDLTCSIWARKLGGIYSLLGNKVTAKFFYHLYIGALRITILGTPDHWD